MSMTLLLLVLSLEKSRPGIAASTGASVSSDVAALSSKHILKQLPPVLTYDAFQSMAYFVNKK